MRTIEDIRHARLLELLALPEFPTVQALADKIGRSNAQVSQWKNRSERKSGGKVTGVSNIESASARHIEIEVGKPIGWMDNDPDAFWPFRFSPERWRRLDERERGMVERAALAEIERLEAARSGEAGNESSHHQQKRRA